MKPPNPHCSGPLISGTSMQACTLPFLFALPRKQKFLVCLEKKSTENSGNLGEINRSDLGKNADNPRNSTSFTK